MMWYLIIAIVVIIGFLYSERDKLEKTAFWGLKAPIAIILGGLMWGPIIIFLILLLVFTGV